MSKNKSEKPKKSKKKTLIIVLSIILALVIAFLIWFFMPRKIITVDIDKVERIQLINGTTGNIFEITDKEEIEYIYDKLKDVKCRLEWLWGMGYQYSIKFFDTLERFQNSLDYVVISSSDRILKDAFSWKPTKGEDDIIELLNYLDSRYAERITE